MSIKHLSIDSVDLEGMLDALRTDGWAVAVHNDYFMEEGPRTFWLFTHPCGVFVKGEGTTDREAVFLACKAAAEVFAPSP